MAASSRLRLVIGLVLALAAAAAVWLLIDPSRAEPGGPPIVALRSGPTGPTGPDEPRHLPTPQAEADQLTPRAGAPPEAPRLREDVGSAVRFGGRVIDGAGAPLAGAEVSFVPTGPTLRASGFAPRSWVNIFGERGELGAAPLAVLPRTRTGPDGRFSLSARDTPVLERNSEETEGAPFPVLVVRRDGFTSATWSARTWKGGDLDAGDIALEPELVVSGRAVDEAGQPVAGAEVRVDANWPKPLQLKTAEGCLFVPELHAVRTGEDGCFTLHGLWPGELTLLLRAPDRVDVDVRRPAVQQTGLDLGDVTLPRGGSIDGIVVDESGAPIPGAEVLFSDREIQGGLHYDVGYGYADGDDTIHDELEQLRGDDDASTDASGTFHLGGLPAANYTLYAAAHGFEPSRLRDVGAGERNARIVLRREALLLVDVRDLVSDARLADAQLSALRLAEPPASERRQGILVVPLEVLSGAQAGALVSGEEFPPGRFLVRGVGFVGTGLSVQAAGHADTETASPGVAVSQLGRFELRVSAEAILRGRVLDAQGAGLAGASVLSCPPGNRYSAKPLATTDEAGRWELRRLPAGSLNLFAQAEGRAESEDTSVELVAGQLLEGVDLTLPRAAAVRGQVRRADGTPLNRWVVLDVPPFGEFKWGQFSRGFDAGKSADADGRFEFAGLRPGLYQISVNGIGKQEVELKAGEERVVDLVEVSLSRLHGRITRVGQPVAELRLQLNGETSEGDSVGNVSDATSDAAGRYEIELRGPGDYELKVKGEGFATAWRNFAVEGLGDVTLDIELPAGRVAGTIVRDSDGAPLAGADIQLLGEDAVVMGSSRADAAGHWSVSAVPPGTYSALFNGYMERESGFGAERRCVWLERSGLVLMEGQDLDGIELRVCPGAKLSGRVTLPGGLAVKDSWGVALVLVREGEVVRWPRFDWVFGGEDSFTRISRDTEGMRRAWTKDGRYEFVGLPAGSYRIALWGDDDEAADVLARGASITLAEHAEATLDLVAPP